MKQLLKIIITCALILIIFTPGKIAVKASTTQSATVNTKGLNVRAKALTKSKKLGTLKKGSKVTVYAKTKSGWSEIRYKNKKAFVYSKYLTFIKKTAKAPSYLMNKKKTYVYKDKSIGQYTLKDSSEEIC